MCVRARARSQANLCITRRFVGDKLDDGLQLLSWQLSQAHAAFYANTPADGFSYSAAAAGSPRAPPSVFSVLADQRGQLLAVHTRYVQPATGTIQLQLYCVPAWQAQ